MVLQHATNGASGPGSGPKPPERRGAIRPRRTDRHGPRKGRPAPGRWRHGSPFLGATGSEPRVPDETDPVEVRGEVDGEPDLEPPPRTNPRDAGRLVTERTHWVSAKTLTEAWRHLSPAPRRGRTNPPA